MIYQDVKRFLKKHIEFPRNCYKWEAKDNAELVGYLEKRYSKREMELGSSEVREAVRDFFEPYYKVIASFSPDNGLTYRCFEYAIKPQDSKHLKNLIELIQENSQYIEYPIDGKSDLICVKGKVRRLINMEINDSNEPINKKSLIRYAIVKALDLDERDVVFYLKRKFMIKIFNQELYLASKKNLIHPKKIKQDTAEQNEQDEERLREHYELLFDDVDLNEFLYSVVDEFFAKKIDFEKLTVVFFEKHAVKAIRDIISLELLNYIDKNNEYVVSFAGYIFRRNFQDIFEKIASFILEEVVNENKNAYMFLQNYFGDTVLLGGIKYKMPILEKDDGTFYNIQTVLSISKMWIKTRQKIDKLLLVLSDVDFKLSMIVDMSKSHDGKHEYDLGMDFTVLDPVDELVAIEKKLSATQKKKLSEMKIKVESEISGFEQNLKMHERQFRLIVKSFANALVKKRVQI